MGRGRGNPLDRWPPTFQNRQPVEPPARRGRGRIDSNLQSLQPGCTLYLNPLHQLMEVQEQRQREEESKRRLGIRPVSATEDEPPDAGGDEGRNVLTLMGTDGSSIINISLTSSSQPGVPPRMRTPSQATVTPNQQTDARERIIMLPSSPGRPGYSTSIMQLQRERA